jgi:hypothetical protein
LGLGDVDVAYFSAVAPVPAEGRPLEPGGLRAEEEEEKKKKKKKELQRVR